MIELVSIEDIKPADYNPRRISDEQIEQLKGSISKIGFVIPVLVNKKNNVIVAGHQRTKTSRLLGIKEVPVMYVDKMDIGDEIKFNQIHNVVDASSKDIPILTNSEYEKERFILIDHKDITQSDTMVTCVKEICKLLVKYGNVLSCVICRNQVLLGNEYVNACKLLNIDINAYICDDAKFDDINFYFRQEYGKYYYGDIEKHTYVQGLAQMHRSTEEVEGKRSNKSKLYETMVLPYLQSHQVDTILDFGCGKGAYIQMLSKKKKAVGVEFYNNNGKQINITKGNRQIDDLIEHLKSEKTFDVVVCDSVLNSVDSMEAEESVLGCLNLFCKDRMFISGRCLSFIEGRKNLKRDVGNTLRYLDFLDGDNFTANYRQGQWYYQHYHTQEDFEKQLEKFGFVVVRSNWVGASFQVECRKVRELEKEAYIKAVDFEFNLPLPNGKRYGRNEDVKKALTLA